MVAALFGSFNLRSTDGTPGPVWRENVRGRLISGEVQTESASGRVVAAGMRVGQEEPLFGPL